MDLSEALHIVREQPHTVLATLRADGTPQMSPVLTAVDDAYKLIISTRRGAYKVRNIRRDNRVWLCILPNKFFGRWIQIDGMASIIELPEALPGLEDYYRRLSGEHEDWSDYRKAMQQEQRVLLRIDPLRAGPDRTG